MLLNIDDLKDWSARQVKKSPRRLQKDQLARELLLLEAPGLTETLAKLISRDVIQDFEACAPSAKEAQQILCDIVAHKLGELGLLGAPEFSEKKELNPNRRLFRAPQKSLSTEILETLLSFPKESAKPSPELFIQKKSAWHNTATHLLNGIDPSFNQSYTQALESLVESALETESHYNPITSLSLLRREFLNLLSSGQLIIDPLLFGAAKTPQIFSPQSFPDLLESLKQIGAHHQKGAGITLDLNALTSHLDVSGLVHLLKVSCEPQTIPGQQPHKIIMKVEHPKLPQLLTELKNLSLPFQLILDINASFMKSLGALESPSATHVQDLFYSLLEFIEPLNLAFYFSQNKPERWDLAPLGLPTACGNQLIHPQGQLLIGSLGVSKILDGDSLDWSRLGQIIEQSFHLLDNLMDPGLTAEAPRHISLGFYDGDVLLERLGLIDLEDQIKFFTKLTTFIHEKARQAGDKLGKNRGTLDYGRFLTHTGQAPSPFMTSLTQNLTENCQPLSPRDPVSHLKLMACWQKSADNLVFEPLPHKGPFSIKEKAKLFLMAHRLGLAYLEY